MMQEVKKLLVDIEQSALNIDIHLEGRRIFEEFAENITKRRAIERELEIIGEATNNLLKLDSNMPLTGARKIVNLRNRVIHAYDDVDETIIWKVIVMDIPAFLGEVQQLLQENK
ncbi:MAG: hypothetical protein JWQ09_1001 [Segetibacter sp.]|nr:hypothetical protein [Segetibacter sp.]